MIITTCEDDAGAAEILMVASYIPSDYFLTARKYLLIFKIFNISARHLRNIVEVLIFLLLPPLIATACLCCGHKSHEMTLH